MGQVIGQTKEMILQKTVSILSCSKSHPDKPWTYAEAFMMQKPQVEKVMKTLAMQAVKSGGWKHDTCINIIFDHFYSEMEYAASMQIY
eukprot:6031655-Ditylum_brightwellii.AAC.1